MASKERGKGRSRPDRLNQSQLQALYGVTAAQLAVDDDLFTVFQKAFEGQWDKARFWSELEQTDWWRRNSKSMRSYLLAAADPSNVDFQNLQEDSREYVLQTALEIGLSLDDADIEDLATQSLMFGWGDPAQKYELERAILNKKPKDKYTGTISNVSQNLKALAQANGIQYNDKWYTDAAMSVAGKRSRPDFWEQKIRQQAASMFPVFADQIEAGLNVYDIAQPYIRTMAEEWDLNMNAITLNDPTLLKGLSNYSDKGNPYAMNLGDFRRMLRNDPRWMETDKAQNEIGSMASQVLKMFGIGN